ncbi:MAG: GNAT family N-acetyltransferase [Roseiflexaceae bacterium]|nr:GNAT family N-acetyltransferase [Roseiflexaceae bacterium]
MTQEIPIAELSTTITHIADLFPGPQLAMVVASIAEGHTAGRLWQTGDCVLLWDQGNNVLYLASTSQNARSQAALADLIDGQIRVASVASGRARFKVRALSADLDAAIERLFQHVELHELPELFLSYDHQTPPVVAKPLLHGLSYELIDRQLLEHGDVENIAALCKEIAWMWPNSERFVQYGFGSAALLDRKVVCWCTAEYMSSQMCGVGITTDPAYEHQGIATATAAHFIAECLKRAVRPYWECAAHNSASGGTEAGLHAD